MLSPLSKLPEPVPTPHAPLRHLPHPESRAPSKPHADPGVPQPSAVSQLGITSDGPAHQSRPPRKTIWPEVSLGCTASGRSGQPYTIGRRAHACDHRCEAAVGDTRAGACFPLDLGLRPRHGVRDCHSSNVCAYPAEPPAGPPPPPSPPPSSFTSTGQVRRPRLPAGVGGSVAMQCRAQRGRRVYMPRMREVANRQR
jgi:hypothetical protein